MLAQNADANARSSSGVPALNLAVHYGAGCINDYIGASLVIGKLLKAKADVGGQDGSGLTALMIACGATGEEYDGGSSMHSFALHTLLKHATPESILVSDNQGTVSNVCDSCLIATPPRSSTSFLSFASLPHEWWAGYDKYALCSLSLSLSLRWLYTAVYRL